MLPTKAELAARAAWMRRPVEGVALGLPLVDGSRAAASADGISKWLKKLASEVLPAARGEEISSKSLRQGAATGYHGAGVSKADAMRQLGHASLSSHMRYVREGRENRGVGSGQQTLSRAVAAQLGAARRKQGVNLRVMGGRGPCARRQLRVAWGGPRRPRRRRQRREQAQVLQLQHVGACALAGGPVALARSGIRPNQLELLPVRS
jgi:hypothetical protein